MRKRKSIALKSESCVIPIVKLQTPYSQHIKAMDRECGYLTVMIGES